MKGSHNATGLRRAVIYTRVSTDEQARTGYSLQDQEQRLRHYCRIQKITVVEHFQDDASAKTFDRPAFQELLEYVRSHRHEIDLLLFVKWDRFSRNAGAAYAMIRRLQDLGIEPRAVEQPLDLTVPENGLMLAFYLAAPEVENERRSLNTKMGMRRAMREGRWISAPPKGYDLIRDKGDKPLLVPNDDAPFITEAFDEMAKGIYGMKEVLTRLRRKGFKFSTSQFREMLFKHVYMGKILIPEWRDEPEELVDALHEPLVSEATFYRVQDVMSERKGRRRGKRTTLHRQLPLRGFLVCKECGGNLTGSASKGNGGTYYYYHCQKGCKERFSAPVANTAFVKYLRGIRVAPEVASLYLAVLEDIFKEKEGDRDEEIRKVERQIDKLNDSLFNVDEKYVEGKLKVDSYERLKTRYTEQMARLDRRKAELERMDSNFVKYARYGFTLVSGLPRYYKEAPLRIRRKLVGLIFPGKLVYDDGEYRTKGLNEVIALLGGVQADFGAKKEGLTAESGNQSYQAALPGFEPGTP